MSRNKSWVVSDTHFGHKGVCEFLNYDGSKMRPWDDVQQMDEDMIQMWNEIVAPNDKVYHLGDVVMNRKALPVLAKLNGKKVLVRGNHDCVDELTEILTQRGWMNIDTIKDSDIVLSRNNKGESVWNPIESIIKREHSGNMIRFETGRMSMLLTENHRVLFGKESNNYCTAKDLSTRNCKPNISIPTTSKNCNTEYPISDDNIKLLAWIYTDGSIYQKHQGVHLWQSKEEGINQIETLLKSMNLSYKKTSRGNKKKGTIVCGKALKKDSKEAFVFSLPADEVSTYTGLLEKDRSKIYKPFFSFSQRQVEVFIRTLIEGNGSYSTSNKNKTSAALHGKKQFLESIQALCVSSGISANLSQFRGNFVLNLNFYSGSKTYTVKNQIKAGSISEVKYSGKVWCIKTEESNFMCRRNGITYFTGNCEDLKHYTPYFEDVRAYLVKQNILFSHIPIHPSSLERYRMNVHGHLHANRVLLPDGSIDPKYLCVCVEQTGFKPIAIEEIYAYADKHFPKEEKVCR